MNKLLKSKGFKVFVEYGVHLWVVLLIANVGLLYAVHYFLIGATCMTAQQVASDSRCLYIYGNQVFNVGSQGSPHHGHPCGTDVTSVLPSSHIGNQGSYLLPNFVADVCTAASPSSAPGVPSPACMGSCPTLTPVPSSMSASPSAVPSLAQPSLIVSTPSAIVLPSSAVPSSGLLNGGNPGDINSLIAQIKQLLQKLLDLLKSIGGGLSSGHGGGHHHKSHSSSSGHDKD